MDATLIALGLAVAGGIIAIALGFVLVRRGRGVADSAEEGMPEPSVTTSEGRARIVDRAVFLALELSRIDGAIGEAEMTAVEDALVAEFQFEREEARQIVHRVLRATMYAAGDREAVEEIGRLADRAHRVHVMTMLRAVAEADAPVVPGEEEFLRWVGRRLGVAPQ